MLGISKEMQQLLPKAQFNKSNIDNFSVENKMCNICLSQYEINEEYMILPCLHRFHSNCIEDWFKNQVTCPNCMCKVIDHLKMYEK